jgi:acetolactate synthase-1/2/3 large subunit
VGEPHWTGATVVQAALRRHGVRTVFALAGAGHAYLLDALDRAGTRIVSGRHETGTIGAADGYSRVTGRIGVALTITDQGLPNAIPGLATAFHAGSPVLVLMARLPDSWTEAEAEYDNLSLSLVRPVTKWCRTVPSAERLAEYVDVACKHALSGRPGPVVLQLPQEFMSRSLPHPGVAVVEPAARTAAPAADPRAVEDACNLLVNARRPLVITGAGATRADAGASVAALSRDFGFPVAGNGLGRGLVPEDWQSGFSWPFAQIAASQADVVLVLGARLKQRLGYGLPPRFAADAKFVQVDVEPEELSRNRRIDVPIVADAGLAARQLVEALKARRFHGCPEPRWLRDALAERRQFVETLSQSDQDPIHPLRLGRELMAQMPEDIIVVGDGADIQNWMYGAIRVRRAPGFMDHYPLGAMGVGMPLAVGAAAASREIAEIEGTRERRVVLVTGDGSLGFYPAELHAATLAGLPLLTIVGNDGAWGTELHGQRSALGRDVNTALGEQRWDHLAHVFGAHGERVERLDQLAPALQRAFAATGPALVDVKIDPAAGATLKQDPRARMIMFDDLASSRALQHGFGV